MDDLDRNILGLLGADARMSVATLALRLKVARSTIQARLERLETTGIIAGYTLKLGEAARQGRLRASVLLTIEPRAQAAILTRLKSIAEIERGVVGKERTDTAQGVSLRRWFDERVLGAFAGRVLSFDLAAARRLATYRVPEHAPYDDALIAAVAEANGMVVATRNTRHKVRGAEAEFR